MLEAFGACGYDVSWRVVNARRWLPQYRERVYLVGLRSDLGCAPFHSAFKDLRPSHLADSRKFEIP